MAKHAKKDPEELEKTTAPEAEEAADEAATDAEEAAAPEATEASSQPDGDALLKAEQEKYLRLYAEFDNFRKRTAKEKSETYAIATAAAVEALLPAVDTFALALAAECKDEAYKEGITKIYQQLTDSLAKLGVTEIPAEGEPFNPQFHNAIKQVEDENFGEGMVCQVFQKGYMLGSRVVRHAMVAVAN